MYQGRYLATLVLALLLFAVSTKAQAQIQPVRIRSSAVGVVDGQSARLNAYFVSGMAGRSELPPGPCRVTLRLLNQAGATLAESVTNMGPSRAAQLDYTPRGLRPGERRVVRADIIAEPDASGLVPAIVPSLEVVDLASGRSTVADLGASRGFTSPAGDFGIFSVASQQVARVNASYVGRPSDSGLPPGPCIVTLTLLNGDGAVLLSKDLLTAPGETVSIDLSAGSLPAGVRQRMWARVSGDSRLQGVLISSIEVFDAPTGKTQLLHPGQQVLSWGWE